MDCAVVVASGPSIPAKSAAHLAVVPSRRLFAPLHGHRTIRRSPLSLVAATRRSHGPYSQDDDDSEPAPSTSSSSPFPSFSAGRKVDEGMVVLRKRIRDAEMAEMNYEPPKDWANWERAYYTKYGSDVCAAVGALQAVLLNTRPAVALGAAAMVALSLPVSAGTLVFAAVQGARAVGLGMGLW